MKKRISVLSLSVLMVAALSLIIGSVSLSAAPKSFKSGKEIYQNHCQMCHGTKGEGSATYPRINNLTLKKFFAGTKSSMSGQFSYIPKANVKKVLTYLKKFSK